MFCRACSEGEEKPTLIVDRIIELEASAGPDLRPTTLSRIGDFVVLEKLGAGGMGAVYKAREITLDRVVALKILPSQFADDPEYIGRFQREARVAAGFHHPNLVSVFNYGSADGCHYIAMELVEGENLHQLLRHRRVDMAEALGITAYVAQGLKCGWDAAQLVHRDIKPSNIYLSFDGHVKVGDLGLAKSLMSNTTGITHTGTMMGTPHYMSPEQCRGDKTIDFRADIYSLGCMLFEMLTGHPPYPGNDPVAIVNKHLNAPPPGLLKEVANCPLPLALLVGRMLKKAPRERHASYDELIAEIEALYEHLERGEELDVSQFRRPVQRTAPATVVSEGMPEWVWWAIVALCGVAVAIVFWPSSKATRVVAVITPAPATPPPQVRSEAPVKTAAIDLLARVNVTRDAIKGDWSSKPDGLSLAAPPGFAVLELPYEPPEEYDFEAEFTPTADGGNPNLYLSAGGSSFAWKLDAYQRMAPPAPFHGFDLLDGQLMFTHSEGVVPAAVHIETGRRYITRVEVRRDGLRGFLDGAAVVRWSGDFRRLSMEPGNRLRNSRALGVGSFARALLFHRITVREVTGAGRLTAEALPASAPAAATKNAPGAPTSGSWHPLFTGDKWKQPIPGQREVVDGRVHLMGMFFFTSRTSADGAVRARIQWREGSTRVGLMARGKKDVGDYRLEVQTSNTVRLGYAPAAKGENFSILGTHLLPKALQPGEFLLLELHLAGDRLTALVDGVPVIEARDSRLPDPGVWGMTATDGWYETIEAQTPTATPAPASASFGPWQPLFTDAEWKQTEPGKREVVDGRVHLLVNQALKPQPADGSIRARIQFQQGTKLVGHLARLTPAGDCYKAELSSDRSVALSHFPAGSSSPDAKLGTYTLPKPLQPGDTLMLELRLQGDRLTVLADGAVVIDAQDARTSGPGKWGIIANDGWFESVEVQTPLESGTGVPSVTGQPTAGTAISPSAFGPWQPFFTEAEWKETVPGKRESVDGRLHVMFRQSKPRPDVDGTISARIQYREETKGSGLEVRRANARYKFYVRNDSFVSLVYYPHDDGSSNVTGIGSFPLPKPLQPGDTLLLELRQQGDHLTGLLNGAVVIETPDLRPHGPGDWGIIASDGWFESVEVQTPLPQSGTGVPPVGAGSTAGTAVSHIAATKDAPFVNSLGMKFVPVPIVGGPTAGKTVLFSVWETRVQDYAAFATETKRDWRKANFEQGPTHPAVNVSWDDATAFCAWLTDRESRSRGTGSSGWVYRLPKDHEWSCAVGIGDREDGAKLVSEKNDKIGEVYPWGTAWPPPPGAGNYAGKEGQPLIDSGAWPKVRGEFVLGDYSDNFQCTAPVGSFAANRFGIYDLGGNVWELCEEANAAQTERVQRGGSYYPTPRTDLRSARRTTSVQAGISGITGFRCVLEAAPSSTATSTVPSTAGGTAGSVSSPR